MGGWKLEVARMCLYMAFPVGVFHYFHQPQYYEDWIVKVKRECFPPESEESNKKLFEELDAVRRHRELEELKRLAKMENM